ncbi:MAG: phosphatidate cytidylyltransferase, partial [Gammaproteobacteria bacterium]
MLKQRLITAAILIPLVVLAILKLPTHILQWCIAGIAVLAAWEWFAIVGIHSTRQRSISFILLIAVAILAWLYINPDVLLVLAVLVWLLATLLILRFAHIAMPATMARIFRQKWFGLLVAIVVLVPFWFSATL